VLGEPRRREIVRKLGLKVASHAKAGSPLVRDHGAALGAHRSGDLGDAYEPRIL
jgi:hypothetical protein